MLLAIEVFKFKPNDLEDFTPQEMQLKEWEALQELLIHNAVVADYIGSICAYTLKEEDEVVVMFGVTPLPEDGANAWLFFSDSASAKELIRAKREIEKNMVKLGGELFTWLKTPVRKDYPQAERLVGMLGFTKTDEGFTFADVDYLYWKRGLDGI